jgi:cytochrome P450
VVSPLPDRRAAAEREGIVTVAYDPRQPAVLADPYPIFARLRESAPVQRSDLLGGWVVTRYDDVKAALNDSRLSADRITPFLHHMDSSGRPVPTLARIVGNWAVFTDPPRHTRLRGLMNKAFTARAVAGLEPRIAAIVDELIGALAGRQRLDLIADFAYPLPVTVIAHMIGVPAADHVLFKTWSDELATFVGSALQTADKYGGHLQGSGRGISAARRGAAQRGNFSGVLRWVGLFPARSHLHGARHGLRRGHRGAAETARSRDPGHRAAARGLPG